MSETITRASIQRRSEFAGVGCVLQGLGLLSPFLGWMVLGVFGAFLGVIAMLGLLLYGSRRAFTYVCGHCHNPVAGRDVRICPVCHAELMSDSGWHWW